MGYDTAIDFVVLSLNRAESTISTIESILHQNGITPIVYLIDQASEESQRSVMENYLTRQKNIHLTKLSSNVGVAKGRNIGISKGNNEFIIELDNDAVFSSSLEAALSIKIFREQSDVSIQGFQIDNYFTNEIDPQFWIYPKKLYKNGKPDPFFATRFPGGGHAIRRTAWEETEGFDPALFFYWEELDLSYQMINKGYKIRFTPEIKILHKSDPNQKINWTEKRYYYLVRNSLYLQYKYFGYNPTLFFLTIGYFFRAMKNGVVSQYYEGIKDSFSMIQGLQNPKPYRMNTEGKEYIKQNDLKYRGNILNRFIKETFITLK